MKSFFDFLFGENIQEVLAKAGFAGAVVGAIGLKNVKIAERLFHVIVGFFTAIFLVPFLIDLINIIALKFWDIKISESPAIIAGTGFLVGRLGIAGLEKLWISLKLNDFLRRFLLFLLKKR